MSGSTTIHLTFLRATLDAAQAEAEAATAGPWWYNPGKQWLGPEAFERYDLAKGEEFVGYGGPHPFTGAVAATGPASDPQAMADARFIARHNPAATLRRIAANRKLIADLARIIGGDYIDDGELPLAEHVLQLIAESWGWAEEQT